jgi:hypothetical protein
MVGAADRKLLSTGFCPTIDHPMTLAPNDFTQLHLSIAPSLRTKT